ncbi:Fc.00g036330.m01.CDS01 [Cosmosporella sp. VM-42]
MAQNQSPSMYKFFAFGPEYQRLQQDAITEVLTLTPVEKRARLGSYELPQPCRAFSDVILQGMICPLVNWAAHHRLIITDLDGPWLRPEAFRLEKACTIWPKPNYTVVLVPLNNLKVEIDLIQRGTNAVGTFAWEPNVVIHFTEMGLRVRGNGSARFIYIMLSVEPDVRVHYAGLK